MAKKNKIADEIIAEVSEAISPELGRPTVWIAMPKVSWSAFIERHPAAHLIAGVVPEGDPIATNSRWGGRHWSNAGLRTAFA